MSPPAIHRSQRSSRNSPPLELEPRGSPRLAAAWVAWCLALMVAVVLAAYHGLASSGPWPWALALPFACMPLGLIVPGWRWLRGLGPTAPRKLRWEADGRWWLQEQGGWAGYVQFEPPRKLGPLVWLSGHGRRGRIHCLLDGGSMEPNALRLLKARVGDVAPPPG